MEHFRPLEKRMQHMRDEGLDLQEIAKRVGHSPEHTEKIFDWMAIPRQRPPTKRKPRPLETRVLAMRAAGETHEQVASRLRRGPDFVRQVEGLAHFRLGLELLDKSHAGGA
ncbi:MAG TPA: hypothetical protein ENH15_04010, partial [Actinobacteria bacterium]|nr:hypothetical protein [Actinomycetota bacterium]